MTEPSLGTHYVSLNTYDENGRFNVPPERVLQVCVTGPDTILNLCKYEEDFKSTTTTDIAVMVVDTASLIAALISQLDGDVGDMAFVRHPNIVRPKS